MEPLMFFPVLVTNQEMPYSYNERSLSEFFDSLFSYKIPSEVYNDLELYKSCNSRFTCPDRKFKFNCWAMQESFNPEVLAIALAELNSDKNSERTRPSYVNDCIEGSKKNDQQFEKLVFLIKSGEKVNNIFPCQDGENISTPLALSLRLKLDQKYNEVLAKANGKVYHITSGQQNRINETMQQYVVKIKTLRDMFIGENALFNQFEFPKELKYFILSTTSSLLELDTEILLKLNLCKPVPKNFLEIMQDSCQIQ